MSKIKLMKIRQRNYEFFIMVADPRKIMRAITMPEHDVRQEIQRPWSEKRVLEISRYVAGNTNLADGYKGEELKKDHWSSGIIPNCPLLNLKVRDRIVKEGGEYYLEILDGDTNLFDILDGQHRLMAFSDKYMDSEFNEDIYETGFVVFKTLDQNLMREIFMICNNKQEQVKSDVLIYLMYQLGIVSGMKESNFKLVDMLNTEDSSPLQHRIKIGGEKIRNGLSATQIMKVVHNCGFLKKLDTSDESIQMRAISEYIHAWYNECPGAHETGHTLRKISGIRYMMFLAPFVYDYCLNKQIKWNEEDLRSVLRTLNDSTGCFDSFRTYDLGETNPFAGESMTIAKAESDGTKLSRAVNDFNPLR